MLEPVKHQCVLPMQLLHDLQKGFDLAVMHLGRYAVSVIDSAAAQLQQLPVQHSRGPGSDRLIIHLQQHIPLQLLVGLFGLIVQGHRNDVLDVVRQRQIVLGLHADADVGDGLADPAVRPRLWAVCAVLLSWIGPILGKKGLPVAGDCPPKPGPAIQQIDLRPQILQAVGRRRAGQLHQAADPRPHQLHGFEALRLRILEAGGLVQHHHVKGPGVAVVVHQPGDVLPVDHPDVPRRVQSPQPLHGAAQYRDDPQVLQVLPLGRLRRPSGLGHLLRRHHQAPGDCPAVVSQLIDGRQGDHRLANQGPYPGKAPSMDQK